MNTQEDFNIQINWDQNHRIPDADPFYFEAIENADCVPYQLIFVPQTEEGYFLKVGGGIEHLTGIPQEDFTERLLQSMTEEVIPLSKDIPADLTEARRDFIRGKIKSYKAEILIRLRDGNRKWIRNSSLPMIDRETGKVIGAFGIFYDITGNKLNSGNPDKIREREEDECESLKVAFLHNLSHEIRTPLNAIVGFATLLGEHPDGPDRRQEYLETITSNADHLLEVIDNVVEMASIEAKTVMISMDRVNLYTVFHRVYDQYKDDACHKGIILRYVPDPDALDAEIYTDSYKLAQVLSNLISNSIKFTNKGKVQFGYSLHEKKVDIYILDTGIGIPREHQASIFSRFFQVDNSSKRCYGGTGLGLAIAKAYVELLGGDIWFTSNPGKGSIFRFVLPLEGETD